MEWLKTLSSIQVKTILTNVSDLAVIVGLSLLAYFSKRLRESWKDRKASFIHRSINHNVRIRELLAEVRAIYGADRVKLLQFHNGDYYVSGESKMKLTLTHVNVRTGVALPVDATHFSQNGIPTTYLLPCLNTLAAKDTYFYSHGHSDEDGFLHYIFTSSGTRAALFTPVKDVRGHWLGIVILGWLSDQKKRPQDEPLLEYAALVGAQMSKKI